MDVALKTLKGKLEQELRSCQDLIELLRSGSMHAYEINAQSLRTYTTQRRLSDLERLAGTLTEAITHIDGFG
ncbi:MAG TPA: hypothetical protein VGV39_11310 [Mesorhizobium sp.]|jgi:hypothetical protein|uniref:hypothetical protein n=1 Tax=Mesorhizobium sp. TaxID=1871066 RepID=UPI002DDCDF0C|nr:hypothetical protein [Mesorhizobium sp.]HEV2503658.1 hypothetical protein [Mesorhizobium sp.]